MNNDVFEKKRKKKKVGKHKPITNRRNYLVSEPNLQ